MKLLPAIGLFFCLQAAWSQQPVIDTLLLKGVEVTGEKPSPRNRSAVPVQRLGQEEIRMLPGGTVSDALKTFPGVTIKDYGGLGGMKTVVVRSMGANHTGVFVDGSPLSDVATGQIDLGRIPFQGLEAVELTIGQGQQLCQPARAQASASMIDFHTVTPDLSKKSFRLETGIKTGSFGEISPFGKSDFRVGKKSVAGISASYHNTRGDYPYLLKNGVLQDTTLRRKNGDLNALNLGFSLRTIISDSAVLKVKSWFYASERGLPGAVIFYNPRSVQRLANRDFYNSIQLSVKKRGAAWLSNLNYSNVFTRYRDPDFLNSNGGLDNKYLQHELYLSQAVSFPIGGIFSLGAAGDFIFNQMQSDQYATADPQRTTGLAFIAIKAKGRQTEATAGILGTLAMDKKPGTAGKSTYKSFSPSFSFVTRLSQSPLLRFRLMAKNSFRLPTFNDLYYNLVGNTSLRPERVSQLNIGFILLQDIKQFQFHLHTDVFANLVKDKIVAVPSQNLFVWSMRNLGKVNTEGVEIQAGVEAPLVKSLKFTINANYTHQRARDMSMPGNSTYKQQIPYVPFQTFTGMLVLDAKSWSLGYNALHNSHRFVLGENIPANLLPAWWVHDVALSWKGTLKSYALNVKAEALNLFDVQYEVIKGFPMSGRGFYLTLSIKY